MTGSIMAGVHEEFPPAQTAIRFPGHRWGRAFVRWSKTVEVIPATATVSQVIDRIEARVTADLSAGGGCVMSIKLNPADIAAGKWDAKLTEVGRWTVGRNLIVIIWHEPEDNHKGAVFAPAFNRARAALKAGNEALLVGWAGMAYQWSLASGSTGDLASWRAVEADLYLLDVYSGNNFKADLILPEHPGFVRWYREIIAPFPGRVWGIAERGFAAGPGRAATWRREFEWLLSDQVGRQCRMYLPWGTGGTEASAAWPFVKDADTTQVVQWGIAALTAPPAPEAPPVPVGYSLSSDQRVGDVLVHEATGVLVQSSHVDEWNGFVERVRIAAAAAAAAAAVVSSSTSTSSTQ